MIALLFALGVFRFLFNFIFYARNEFRRSEYVWTFVPTGCTKPTMQEMNWIENKNFLLLYVRVLSVDSPLPNYFSELLDFVFLDNLAMHVETVHEQRSALFRRFFPFLFPLFVMFYFTGMIFDPNSTPEQVSLSSAVSKMSFRGWLFSFMTCRDIFPNNMKWCVIYTNRLASQ